jgi:hypothetical protein
MARERMDDESGGGGDRGATGSGGEGASLRHDDEDVSEEGIGGLHGGGVGPAEDRAEAYEEGAGGDEGHTGPVVRGEAAAEEGDGEGACEYDDAAAEHLEDGCVRHGETRIHGAGAEHVAEGGEGEDGRGEGLRRVSGGVAGFGVAGGPGHRAKGTDSEDEET